MNKITAKARIIALITVLSVLASTVLLIFLFSPNKKEIKVPGNVALTVDGTKLTVGFYNYFYSSSTTPEVLYNIQKQNEKFDPSMPLEKQIYDEASGKTWAVYIEESVLEQIGALVYAYNRGVEANIGLFDEQRERIDANLASLRAEAKKMKISADRYTSLVYGDYVGIKTVESILEMSYVAQNYYEYYRCNFSLTEEDYNSYMLEQKENLAFAEYSICEFTFESADALTAFCEMHSDLTAVTADNFKAEIEEKTADIQKTFRDFSGIRSDCTESDEIRSWAFSFDRKAGDRILLKDEERLVAYILISHRDTAINKEITCSARELTLRKSDFNTPEDYENAKKRIEQKLSRSSVPQYDMAVLCDIYMNNNKNANPGGLVTCIEKSESAANTWLFDKAKKKGDYTVLTNEDNCYFLMFTDKKESWRYYADDACSEENFNKASDRVTIKKHNAFKHTGSVWTDI